MNDLALAVLATFGAVVVGGTNAISMVIERRRVQRTLRALPTAELRPDDLRERTLAIPALDRLMRPLGRWIMSAARRLTPLHQLERFTEKLDRAGTPPGWDASRLAALRLLGRVVVPIVLFVLLGGFGMATPQALVLAALGGVAMHLGPDVLLDGMISRRQDEIRAALPDTIDLLTITVEAGLGFDAALERVSRTTHDALGDELRRAVHEMQLGRSRAEAMREMAERVGLPELRSLVSALIQAEQFGITIGVVLRTQASELRERRRQRAEEHAQKIPVKVLVPLIFCILPVLFVVLLGPGAIQIYDQLLSVQ